MNSKPNAERVTRGRKTAIAGGNPGSATLTERGGSKQELVLSMLNRSEGTTVTSVMEATGWQPHSVRGFFSGVVRKKLGLPLTSELTDGVRVYRTIAPKPVRARSKKAQADLHSPE